MLALPVMQQCRDAGDVACIACAHSVRCISYVACECLQGASGAGSLGSSDAWAEARVVATLTEASGIFR